MYGVVFESEQGDFPVLGSPVSEGGGGQFGGGGVKFQNYRNKP